MLEPLSINHLNLPASDPEALCQWYVNTLGFQRNGNFLWSGGTLLVFNSGQSLNNKDYHFGFRVSSLAQLELWVAELRERGLDVPDIDGDESYSHVRFTDPEGNGIELFYEPVVMPVASPR